MNRTRHSGFTLIEMLVVLAIMSITISIAAPSIKSQIESSQLKLAASDVDSILKQARSEALIIRTNAQVSLETDKILTATRQNRDITNGTVTTSTLEANPFARRDLNENVVVTTIGNMPNQILFTSNKRATSVDGNLLQANMGYKVCYKGSATSGYVILVDALTNITLVPGSQLGTQGGCS